MSQTLEMLSDVESLSHHLLSQFEANIRFFSSSPLLKYLQKPNERLELHLSSNGINIYDKPHKKLLYSVVDGKSSIFTHAKAVATSPLDLIAVQNGVETIDENRFNITGKAINKIYSDLMDSDFVENKIYKKAQFAKVFYGLGAGLFLNYITTKNGVFVYEPDSEFFTISAYFVDYEDLMRDGKLYLVVGGKLTQDPIKRFFAQDLINRGFIRGEFTIYPNALFDDAKNCVEEAHRGVLRGWGTVEDEIYGVQNKLATISASDPQTALLKNPQVIDTPIAVIGSGASLDSSLALIRSHQENIIIFSSGTALKPLLNAGIKPDFHIEIERRSHVANLLKSAPLGDIPLLCADIVHPTTLEVAKEKYIFIRASSASSTLWDPAFIVEHSHPVVGNAAAALASLFAKDVYLFGVDVGFKKGANVHASNSLYSLRDDKSIEAVPTRGNFSNNILTNSLLNASKSSLETLIRSSTAKFYNCSDGAFVQGATPTKDPKFAKIDKKRSVKIIKQAFTKKGFFGTSTNPAIELEKVKNELSDLMRSIDIKNLSDLMLFNSNIYIYIENISNSTIKNLISGTLLHILNAQYRALLQVQLEDISKQFLKTKKSVLNAIEQITI